MVALKCCAFTAHGLRSVTTVLKVFVLGTWLATGVQVRAEAMVILPSPLGGVP